MEAGLRPFVLVAVSTTYLLLAIARPVIGDTKKTELEIIEPSGVPGALVIAGGGGLPDAAAKEFVRLAKGSTGFLIVIPTASVRADTEPASEFVDYWKKRGMGTVQVLHTRDRQLADSAEFVRDLAEKATGVWIDGGDQSRLTEAYLGTAVERAISNVLKKGGVVGGTSAGAAVLSKAMITGSEKGDRSKACTAAGFDLLPGGLVDQHFSQRDRRARLENALEQHPGRFGLGVDEATAVVVRGRSIQVLGKNKATIVLAKSPRRKALTVELLAGTKNEADLTQWRRAARERALETPSNASASKPRLSVVPKGRLVIVGGGGLPAGLAERFVEAAGGPASLIVVLPTAMPDPIPERAESGFLRRAGATNIRVLPARRRAEVEDPANLAVLSQAKGVWFGGGRQWRFVDAYLDTKAAELFHGVLQRGGVIGGSSAGATIQGEYLCRGSPIVNTIVMCEGYERGLGLLPGSAIDQHFAQRKRFDDLTRLAEIRPEFLGIGIDETTAIEVQGSVARVSGRVRCISSTLNGRPARQIIVLSPLAVRTTSNIGDPSHKRSDRVGARETNAVRKPP